MCRSLQQHPRSDRSTTQEEINASALQFVGIVSGFRRPSRINQAAFDQAVAEIAATTRTLLDHLNT